MSGKKRNLNNMPRVEAEIGEEGGGVGGMNGEQAKPQEMTRVRTEIGKKENLKVI